MASQQLRSMRVGFYCVSDGFNYAPQASSVTLLNWLAARQKRKSEEGRNRAKEIWTKIFRGNPRHRGCGHTQATVAGLGWLTRRPALILRKCARTSFGLVVLMRAARWHRRGRRIQRLTPSSAGNDPEKIKIDPRSKTRTLVRCRSVNTSPLFLLNPTPVTQSRGHKNR
jgi:hypothetical protein